MAKFKIVLLKHAYPNVRLEQELISQAGGELVDADRFTEEEALRQCEDAEGILVRWLPITPDLIHRFRRCKVIVRYGVGVYIAAGGVPIWFDHDCVSQIIGSIHNRTI